MTSPALVEHFFRHEYGRVVSKLSRQVGLQHLELVEDSVQSALLTGLESWAVKGLPDNPTAWLYTVARHNALGQLRQNINHQRILSQFADDITGDIEDTPADVLSKEFNDDLLRMLFVCCNENIPTESQLVVALKTLCGFSISEISHRLFCSEASVYKRFSRAKNQLKKDPEYNRDLNPEEYSSRLPNVHNALYLLFTEGYLSVNTAYSIRYELCGEAIRLATILAQHDVGQTPETFALLALMHFQTARMSGRQNDAGGLILLEEQDRTRWDQNRIHIGMEWLERSASGEHFSRFHAEAGIAAEHCLAGSFQRTRWDRIAENYLLLEKSTPSAIHRLNRAVAVAEWKGPAAGLMVLNDFKPPGWLSGSYLWCAVLADLYLRCDQHDLADDYSHSAIKLAPTSAVKDALKRRYHTQRKKPL